MGVLKRRYVIQPHVLRVLCVPSLLLNDDHHRVLTDFFFFLLLLRLFPHHLPLTSWSAVRFPFEVPEDSFDFRGLITLFTHVELHLAHACCRWGWNHPGNAAERCSGERADVCSASGQIPGCRAASFHTTTKYAKRATREVYNGRYDCSGRDVCGRYAGRQRFPLPIPGWGCRPYGQLCGLYVETWVERETTSGFDGPMAL